MCGERTTGTENRIRKRVVAAPFRRPSLLSPNPLPFFTLLYPSYPLFFLFPSFFFLLSAILFYSFSHIFINVFLASITHALMHFFFSFLDYINDYENPHWVVSRSIKEIWLKCFSHNLSRSRIRARTHLSFANLLVYRTTRDDDAHAELYDWSKGISLVFSNV